MKGILKYLIIIIPYFCGQILFSQTDNNKINRFSLGVVFTPQFSNWQQKTTSEYQWMVDHMDSIYINKNGFSLGIIVEYEINNKLSLKSGLQTSYYPYETIVLESNVQDPLIPCGHFLFTGSDHFIDLPIILKFNLLNTNRTKLFFSAGLINKFLSYTRVKSYSICGKERDLVGKSGSVVDFFNYFMAASIETGIDILITDRIITGIYPSFEYSFLNIKKNNEIRKHYYLVGLNLSLSYKL